MTRTFKTFILLCLLLLGAIGGAGAQTTFSGAASGARFLPVWTSDSFAATTDYHSGGTGSDPEIRVDFLGTALSVRMVAYFNVNAVRFVTVDGSNVATPAPLTATQVFQIETLASGLTDAWHTAIIKFQSNNTNGIFVDQNNSFQVSGGTPQMRSSAGLGPLYATDGASPPAWINNEYGSYQVRGNGGGNDYIASQFSDASLTFRATTSSLFLYGYMGGAKWRLTVDPGTATQASLSTVSEPAPSPAYYGLFQVATGLDSAKSHVYRLTCVSLGAGGEVAYLMTSGGTGVNTVSSAPATISGIAGYGDSITAGTTGTGDSSSSFLSVLAASHAFSVANRGIGGTSTYQYPSGAVYYTTLAGQNTSRIAQVTSLSPAPKMVFVLYGANDAWQQGGAETAAQYQGAYYSMMNQLTTALPTTKFVCISILPTTQYVANRLTFNSAFVSAIGSGGDGGANVLTTAQKAQIIYLNSDTFGLNTGTDLTDGVHPNASGYAKIAAGLQRFFLTLFRHSSFGSVRLGSRSSQ